jgi:hypothetical protein
MQTLQTLPAESLAVILTAGIGFVLSVSIVIGYLIEKPLRFVASFFL